MKTKWVYRIQMIVIIIALILNLAIFLIRVMPADAGSISYDWEMECIGTPIVYPLSANRSIIYCDGMDDPLGVRK